MKARGLKTTVLIVMVAGLACTSPRSVAPDSELGAGPSGKQPDAGAPAAPSPDGPLTPERGDGPIVATDAPIVAPDAPPVTSDAGPVIPTTGPDVPVVCLPDQFECDGACLPRNQPSCCRANRTIDTDHDGIADCEQSLLPGGQFSRGVGPWLDFEGRGLTWSPLDRGAAGTSGSLRLTDTGAFDPGCLAIKGGQNLALSLDYFIPPGQATPGHAEIGWAYYKDACLNTIPPDSPQATPPVMTKVGEWTRLTYTLALPAGMVSLRFFLFTYNEGSSDPFVIHIDNLVLRRP